MNIWELAYDKLRENETKMEKFEEKLEEIAGKVEIRRRNTSHLIICGSARSGKSSLVGNFLDKNEEPKETIAMEYTYARRTRGRNKDVCHIWELGGETNLVDLLYIPLTAENIEFSSITIVVDLSRPNELWSCLETLTKNCRKVIDSAIKDLSHNDSSAQDRITAWKKTIGAEHKDESKISAPFPIPLMIVGAKYDEFQDIDSEQRRSICSTLRFIAYYYGAHLMFYSSRIEQLCRLGKNMLSHLAFGTVAPRARVDDHNKPLYIPCGLDSFESIGPPSLSGVSFSRATQPLELWKEAFTEQFPQTSNQHHANDDPSIDPLFKEPLIDNLVEQKQKDLELYIKQKQKSAKSFELMRDPKTTRKQHI